MLVFITDLSSIELIFGRTLQKNSNSQVTKKEKIRKVKAEQFKGLLYKVMSPVQGQSQKGPKEGVLSIRKNLRYSPNSHFVTI